MNLKAVRDVLVGKWWVFYGISLTMFFLGLIIAIFGPPIPKSADEVVFYPWISLRDAEILNSIPLVPFIIGTVLYGLRKKSFRAPFLLAGGTIFCCVVVIALLGPQFGKSNTRTSLDPTLNHADTMRISGHVYNLARYQSVFFGKYQYYILYECDNLGINCRAIYRYESQSLEDVHADIDHPPILSSDEANITLQIAGKVVYVYPISGGN